MNLKHGSLYTGIGGWLLAARWAGIENVFICEIDDFCNKVIEKNFPEIPKENRHGNIKETDFTKYRGSVDILSTSDPCQPFSFAGKRGGKADDRFLWPETIRAVREIKPAYVVFENVPGFIGLAFGTVASDLEAEGYTVESFIIPACAVGAWHRRDRLWIVAYTNGSRRDSQPLFGTKRTKRGNNINIKQPSKDVPDTNIQGFQKSTRGWVGCVREKERTLQGSELGGTITKGWNKGTAQSRLGRMVDGLSPWMDEPDIPRIAKGVKDRANRLMALGNSIVPQIAYLIFEAIKIYDSLIKNKG